MKRNSIIALLILYYHAVANLGLLQGGQSSGRGHEKRDLQSMAVGRAPQEILHFCKKLCMLVIFHDVFGLAARVLCNRFNGFSTFILLQIFTETVRAKLREGGCV